jgi:hypothetical protein
MFPTCKAARFCVVLLAVLLLACQPKTAEELKSEIQGELRQQTGVFALAFLDFNQ